MPGGAFLFANSGDRRGRRPAGGHPGDMGDATPHARFPSVRAASGRAHQTGFKERRQAMLLAEALALRADQQKLLKELTTRIEDNSRVPEGAQPDEDPVALLER